MALEAGKAMHDVFAGIRLFDLLENGEEFYANRPENKFTRDAVLSHGNRLFGEDRWREVHSIQQSTDDLRTRLIRASYHLIATSGFYDDPSDRRRTVTNLEEAAAVYIDRYPLGRAIPFVCGSFVGVEVEFDVIVVLGDDHRRFVGKVDGLCYDSEGKTIEPHENKTASRLDDAWHMSHVMSHQVTGYMIALEPVLASMGFAVDLSQAVMYGLCIPVPRSADYGGYSRHPVDRLPHHKENWFRWFQYTVTEADKWFENPHQAPLFTHSCNRYFRPCPLVAYCHGDQDERVNTYNEMDVMPWHPLEEGNE